jgi:hypothetical protein
LQAWIGNQFPNLSQAKESCFVDGVRSKQHLNKKKE